MFRRILPLLIATSLLFACKDEPTDPGNNDPQIVLPTVTTGVPGSIMPTSANLFGSVTDLGGGSLLDFGFCVGLSPDPAGGIDSRCESASSYNPLINTGGFDMPANGSTFQNGLITSNTTYYVRAYATNEAGTAYGENVEFRLPDYYEFESKGGREIGNSFARLYGKLLKYTAFDLDETGFLFSEDINVLIDDPDVSGINTNTAVSSGDYNIEIENLDRNTTYYYRAYGYDGSFSNPTSVYYGEIDSFTTTGYSGEGGGVVFYDKGEYSNGWRYLEIGLADIGFGVTSFAKWGCASNLIVNTADDLGAGPANTQAILAICGEANCAARLCDDHSGGSKTDWFLGSDEEMILLERSAGSWLTFGSERYWTSTEVAQSTAVSRSMNFSETPWTASKTDDQRVRPMRRY